MFLQSLLKMLSTAADDVYSLRGQMLRSLVQVVGRSNDVPAMLHVLDAYLLLGPPDILQPYLQPVTALLARCIQAAAQALSDAQNQPTARFPGAHTAHFQRSDATQLSCSVGAACMR